ncbi:hypothetical protein [Bifidobacterium myosotis]|uniref:Uncharacterized protein n=1 Tax=Bifidobacterium myosotis TaxID=1630166 RepID=A0A5M9ZHQ2_9BIFI|nr:hypothetical protein [Bifidobacterium myosotis]KAA8826913.1 hypothetical protein EMO91_10295 [Bifidobacterium myosotis]
MALLGGRKRRAGRGAAPADDDGMDAGWERPDPKADGTGHDEQFAHKVKRLLGINLAKWQRWAILGALVVVVYFQMNPVAQQIDIPETQLDPPGRVESWNLTEQWLKDNPLGKDARIVSWDGQETVDLKNGSKTSRATVNTLVVDSSLGWWRVRTTIREDGTLAGWPSAEKIRLTTTATPNSTDDWPGTLGSLTQSEALQTTVSKWASAYMGPDSDMLTVLIADPDPNANYQALDLGEVGSASIEKAAYLNSGNVDRNQNKSDRALLRVTITLNARSLNEKQTQFSYDMLVADPDGTPRILAWGAPGSGLTLRERENRLPAGQKPVDAEDSVATSQGGDDAKTAQGGDDADTAGSDDGSKTGAKDGGDAAEADAKTDASK